MIKNATIHNVPFWICLVISIMLIVSGFLVPPTGEVDGSVLTAVGELFGFAALYTAWIAIMKGVDARVQHGKTQLVVGNFSEQDYNMPQDDESFDNK